MPGGNLPPSDADLARLISRVEKMERKVRALGARSLDALDDTYVDQRVDGNALVFDGDLKKWVPGASGGSVGASGRYAEDATDTTVPNNTLTALTWPTLTQGTELLDLSDLETPVVLADGVYTLNAVVQVDDNQPTPTVVFEFAGIVVDAGASFAGAGAAGASNFHEFGVTVTAFLHAGSTVQVFATQVSGGPVDALLIQATLTWISATEGTP